MTSSYFKQSDLDSLSPKDLATLRDKHARRWEAAIRKECASLSGDRRAFVDKNWEAPKIPGTHQRVEESKPDFSGHLSDGSHVVFEAKTSLHKTRFSFDQIRPGQADHLADAEACGAVSFIYLLDNLRRRWVIPWSVVERLKAIENRQSFAYPESPHFIDRFSACQKRPGETWLDAYTRLEMEGIL